MSIEEAPMSTERTNFPEAEAKYRWLPPVLDAYAMHADGQNGELRAAESSRGEKVACHKGCSACCKSMQIDVLRQEISTISWYVSEIMDFESQERIKPRLLQRQDLTECPFLLDDACSIYPVRPLTCRGFIVFRKVCEVGEDPIVTRRSDVFIQSKGLSRRVALRVLDGTSNPPWKDEKRKKKAYEAGVMKALVVPLHQGDPAGFSRAIEHWQQQRGFSSPAPSVSPVGQPTQTVKPDITAE